MPNSSSLCFTWRRSSALTAMSPSVPGPMSPIWYSDPVRVSRISRAPAFSSVPALPVFVIPAVSMSVAAATAAVVAAHSHLSVGCRRTRPACSNLLERNLYRHVGTVHNTPIALTDRLVGLTYRPDARATWSEDTRYAGCVALLRGTGAMSGTAPGAAFDAAA